MPWSDAVFAQAKQENRFVLLDLEAVWCHWCHARWTRTDVSRSGDDRVAEIEVICWFEWTRIRDPDLASLVRGLRMARHGGFQRRWKRDREAAGLFAAGTNVVDVAGDYRRSNAGAVGDSGVAEWEFAEIPFSLSRASLGGSRKIIWPVTIRSMGAGGTSQKYLDWDGVEYAFSLARKGDLQAERMARQTMDAQFNLIDPAWGGVYQYSTDGDWKHPHFEKIMQMQAENLRIYSLAYAQFRKPEYLKAALDIHRYLKTFLMSPDGAFYTSQDADLIDGEHSDRYFKLADAGVDASWEFRASTTTFMLVKTGGRSTRWRRCIRRLPDEAYLAPGSDGGGGMGRC